MMTTVNRITLPDVDYSPLREAVQQLAHTWFIRSYESPKTFAGQIQMPVYRECSEELLKVLQRFDQVEGER